MLQVGYIFTWAHSEPMHQILKQFAVGCWQTSHACAFELARPIQLGWIEGTTTLQS